jgi:hypothetical protein
MLGGRVVWVGMSRGRFVGGRNVKAPLTLFKSFLKIQKLLVLSGHEFINSI